MIKRKMINSHSLIAMVFAVICASSVMFAQPKFESTNTAPGEFARLGFLPRGIAMGNAMSAVREGQLSGFYNPALGVFQEYNSFQAAYTFMTLDRTLNYLGFTRRFQLSKKDTSQVAGISFGLINAGVSNIGEYDNSGYKRGDLSTSENLFFFSFSNRFSKKVSFGFGVKIYYYKLYDNVTSTGTGFDLGLLYKATNDLNISLVLADMNAKYKWDTGPVYSTDGSSTTDNFPMAKKIGVSYGYSFKDDSRLIGSMEFEFNDYGRKLLRAGAEYRVIPEVAVRAGLDNIVLNNSDELIQPAGGFSVRQRMYDIDFAIEYSFVIEQYSKSARHTAGLSIVF
ncbi:MAG: hypothetical protein LWX56_06710 [Ignavibacteria bacterium]|nr:hypothetical protein [Ignavibacteria bacterium]